MALRAGYYGVKRGLKDKLAQIAGVWDSTVNSIYTKSANAIYGAYNIFNNTATTRTDHGVTMTVNADKSVKFTGGPSSEAGRFGLGNFDVKANTLYYLSGCPAGGGDAASNYWLALYSGSTVVYRDTGNGLMFLATEDATLTMSIRIPNNWNVGTAGVTFKPMIALVPDAVYAPYSMSNIDLTNALLDDESVIADHKTTINAIISAATGAADFAAFKTAMAALTPLTRSAVSEMRSVEEIEEQPVQKTTRKKSTAKADTKEEV